MNEIETIFCKLFKCDRSRLYLDRSRPALGARQCHRLEGILKKRIGGQPLQYLLGDAAFMGLLFKVRPGVLIPRPETELLVEEAIKGIAFCGAVCPRILDIGTGCGNIAISLARFLDKVRIDAVDISGTALSVAKQNARSHRVQDKIKFIEADLFSCFAKEERFDLIVSNPPYIPVDRFDDLPQDVRQEPPGALLAEEDGLYFYSRIEQGARRRLGPGGLVYLEIGDGQGPGLRKIFSDRAFWREVKVIRDHNDRERVVIIRKG